MGFIRDGWSVVIENDERGLIVDDESTRCETGLPIEHNILLINKMFWYLHLMKENSSEECTEDLQKMRDYAQVIEQQVHSLVDAIDTTIKLREVGL